MRINPIPLITSLLLLYFPAGAQDDSRYTLSLKSGAYIPAKNITTTELDRFNWQASKTSGISFAVIQFEEIPGVQARQRLKEQGIELHDYIPGYAYTATIRGMLEPAFLQASGVRALVGLTAAQKMEPALAKGNYPARMITKPGMADVWISFPASFPGAAVISELSRRHISVISSALSRYGVLSVRVPLNELNDLALQPFIEYIQPVPAEDKPVNYNSMYASRANILRAPAAMGGSDLNGQGVVVGVGDNGDVQTHLDFTGRLINRAGVAPANHALHVTGTAGGAGLIRELYTGYAPKATILSQVNSGIWINAGTYVSDHGMVITNNSYGSVVDDCSYNGLYDLTSRILDQQAFDLPELTHVFAAGNDGTKTCTPYPTGFKNVLGGYQSAKNVITVGSTDYKSDISIFSSRGPVRDGRLKPDIMSMGTFVASTWAGTGYSYNNGTSMAAPGVSGGLALLVQRYRQLNAGANPESGLLKALVSNGGRDLGNSGPDFSYGFGMMNLPRSVTMMENNWYVNGTVAQGVTNTETISVPANTAQLKVMLYWHDPPAAVMAAKTLVNDLDLEVINPSAATILPARLDTLPANVSQTATTGADHINNIEQVIINNPASGNYDLRVSGTTVAQGPTQEYFLVYDIIPSGLVLTNPFGGEAHVPTTTVLDTLYIQWEDYEGSANTYTLEFSSNNGSSWTTLNNSIPSASRIYSWAVPNTPTDVARIRISKNGTGLTQTSGPFTIMTVPVVTLPGTQCEGYISINWTSVPSATDYEVMRLQGDQMVSVTTTTSLNHIFSGLSSDSVYWVTVRPRINGNPGRRAVAVSRQPNNGTCAGTISDNDLKIDAIVSPASSGRLFTSTALSASVPVTIRIKNLDNAASSGDISVSYSINGGTPVNEVITAPTANIAAGGTLNHTFSVNADLSAAGVYSIAVSAVKASDPVTVNNSYTKVFKQLDNPAITSVDLPWLDDMESAGEQTVVADQMGLDGSDRYDFYNSTAYGRLRTFINTGMAYSGSKALTLDMSRYVLNGNIDSLTGTFNLGTFNPATDDIRLDFRYKNHGQDTHTVNKVWIRGSDTDNWIEMYDLLANQPPADGTYKLSTSLELADSLIAHGQTFSGSFQARWGQWGEYQAADDLGGAGYSFDDIRLYRAIDDIQALDIDTPVTVACNLNSTVPVRVTVRNTSAVTISNIPVVLRVDAVVVANETIASIPGDGTIQYTFSPGSADLSVPGNHTVEVWVDYGTDNVRQNDTVRVTVNSLPLISSFPYLEDFESGEGHWFTETGQHSSWAYGAPLSAKINRAASGSNAWKTNRTGYYNDSEYSYLYSPCYDLSAMTNPTLSLSLALDIEDCGVVLCDAAWVEYSNDGGLTWNKLGAFGSGTNWYNRDYAGNHVWSQQDYTRWHVATTALPTTNNSSLHLRFVFNSDGSLTKDGIAVDDIHIYDNVYGIYETTGTSPVVNQSSVSGNGWIDFVEGGSNKLIASINPDGQNLGSTDVQSYIHTGPVRTNSAQYYHNRNITIKPATVNLPDSARVRFYFLDSETEALVAATGCPSCHKPSSAYELGVTKYSDPDDNMENGTLADNTPGLYIFINSAKTKKVPFDKGYYAEFKVKDFSEFWLNNGGFDFNQPLPVQLLSFTAKQKTYSTDVLAEWVTASEYDVSRFEVEVAKGNLSLQENRFVKIGEVNSAGNSTSEQRYQFIDAENNKSGVRYYRLKMIDMDGSFTYSPVRAVVFDNDYKWQVSPNPSAGLFTLHFQAAEGEIVSATVYDLDGRAVRRYNKAASGFVQQLAIDLQGTASPAGLYMLEVRQGNNKQIFKLLKQ